MSEYSNSDASISAEDHARITAAIRAAEAQTSGEIYAVVAHASDDYFYVAGFWAAVWSSFVALVLAVVTFFMEWQLPLGTLLFSQVLTLIVLLLAFAIVPRWRMNFVPHSVAYRRASHNALRQFLSHNIHTTKHRSGVLLFVSLAEHYAQVIADEGINDKVEQVEWDSMVADLTSHAAKDEIADGFVLAITKAGDLLALHFPRRDDDENELDDRLVEI